VVMRMGPIVAVRAGSAAANVVLPKDGSYDGDRIVEVEIVNADKSVTIFANDAGTGRTVQPLDPVHLPIQLNHWADRTPGPKRVKLTVLRENSVDHTQKRETLDLAWNDEARFDLTGIGSANTPLPLNALGLAYQAQSVIDRVVPESPAAKAGLLAGDTIQSVRIRAVEHAGTIDEGTWQPVKPHQWASVDSLLQSIAPHEADFRVLRGTTTTDYRITAEVTAKPLPLDDRGLQLMPEFRIQLANSVGEAVGMGAHRTTRKIREVYLNLYAMIFGRVNPIDTISGPITLARVSYILAGESYLRLLLMLALVSINLAVMNFLPIPILDGGHMMFLTYEAFRGKPPPERIHTILTVVGLICVFAMLIFVVGVDIYRLIKVWMRW
jgi:regulator of sigma E protease